MKPHPNARTQRLRTAACRVVPAALALRKKISYRIWILAVTVSTLVAGHAPVASAATKAFAYVGAPYIFTAEPSGAHQFVINMFNLSDYVIVFQPSEFIYKGASGQFYIGQVIDLPTKSTRGDNYRFSASFLLSGSSFKAFNVLGAFKEQDHIEEISIRVGAKRYYMEPLDKIQFDDLGVRIGDLDLKNPDAQAVLRKANIPGMGRVTTTDGTAEWDRDWQNLLLPEGINPPRIIEKPEVLPTEEASRTDTYGNVRLSATITRDGTIQNLSVVKGLGHGLDERAVDAVKASWIFLPATKNGEVVETDIKFDVAFAPPKKESGDVSFCLLIHRS